VNPSYELSEAAADDLLEIAHYTVSRWGMDQAVCYEQTLKDHFEDIGHHKVRARVVLKHRPDYLISRCEHHYVFHLTRKSGLPRILGVFHENMDLMRRIRKRMAGIL